MNKILLSAIFALVLAGCSGSGGVSTASILGADAAPKAPPAPTPASRAMQVGSVAARAMKCGYNFDPFKLKTSFLAAEQAGGTTDLVSVEKVYDTAYNGVIKGAATKSEYCSDNKTAEIKADLSRHLAGDYNPPALKQVAQEDGGLFSGWGDTSGEDEGPKWGSDDWWDRQTNDVGKR